MEFLEKLKAVGYVNLPAQDIQTGSAPAVATVQAVPAAGADAVTAINTQEILTKVDSVLTIIEQVTGLTRREISLQVLKSGVRGGGLGGVLEGLLGQKPAPEAKFIRYVKIIAIWVPAFIFFMGLAIVGVILFARLMMSLTGGAL